MSFARLGVFGVATGTLLISATAPAAQTVPGHMPVMVQNFTLVDAQQHQSHELYKMANDKAVVLVSTEVGCPIARAMTPALKALRDKYAAQGVEIMMINSNLQDGQTAIAAEAKEFGIDIPILMDKTQAVGEALGVTRTAEVFVVTPTDLEGRLPWSAGRSIRLRNPEGLQPSVRRLSAHSRPCGSTGPGGDPGLQGLPDRLPSPGEEGRILAPPARPRRLVRAQAKSQRHYDYPGDAPAGPLWVESGSRLQP